MAYLNPANEKVRIFDSTLRDGIQAEGISYSISDKLAIAKALDHLSIDYIEAGNPYSNPRDMEFFKLAQKENFSHAELVAFGSTRHKDRRAEEDPNLLALLASGANVITIFGKSHAMQVREVLGTTLEYNLQMIMESISFLKQNGLTVFFDAEHFFDGYLMDAEYALSCLEAAQTAGADAVVLCDTNGGRFPDEICQITAEVKSVTSCAIGIHCHNDNGCAVASSILAVRAGATQVQGTFLGFGERCGNANLSAIIPSLQLKLGYSCILPEKMKLLTQTARLIADQSNFILDRGMPYVGDSAFSHKGGMHVDGVSKNTSTFEHISPEMVGNKRNILISELSGRSAVLSAIHEVDPNITKESKEAIELTELLKELESKGYLFESASASLSLLIAKKLGQFRPYFHLQRFKVIGEQDNEGGGLSSAMITIKVGDQTEISAAEGDGPVHALDLALKKAISRFYPEIKNLRLVDYKVRVMEPERATAATVRVLIVTSDKTGTWGSVGVSKDIIEASLNALLDSIEYKLMKQDM